MSESSPSNVPPKAIVRQSVAGPHLDGFAQAMHNILSTKIAEETFAQLLDGLPLADVAQDSANAELPYSHPLFDVHEELCPGVLEKTRQYRHQLDATSLQLDAALIADYRAASPGSRAFNTRLVEMAAVAVHEMAVQLFNNGPMFHSDDGIASWVPPKDDDLTVWWEFFPDGAWPTLFRHGWYVDHDQYPNGVADMAGYWAEARIFGGVVLFDRRSPITCPDAEPDSVWIHPDRAGGTYRLVQLLDGQKQALLALLTLPCPNLALLPILVDKRNTVREDPEEPIDEIGIYRDKWDRKPLAPDAVDSRRARRCVWDQTDYPTRADFDRACWRGRESESELYRSMQ
ncbi:Uncharacterized protein TPAR_06241 [Tolypocladium paradoxum]|uniref:Uncharacterized protein n=1 Tax=Tolypocladium paradoxum TaxID=94208 RepID=A0A2S4KTN2_9HYPO|nr:Uncharacterized protein TPAR_06241 [Tolypocladium paradoxum]